MSSYHRRDALDYPYSRSSPYPDHASWDGGQSSLAENYHGGAASHSHPQQSIPRTVRYPSSQQYYPTDQEPYSGPAATQRPRYQTAYDQIQIQGGQMPFQYVPAQPQASGVPIPAPMAQTSPYEIQQHSRGLSNPYPQHESHPSPPSRVPGGPAASHRIVGYNQHYAVMMPPDNYPASHPSYAPLEDRPFICDLCSLAFQRQHDLKRHRDTHKGEKPHMCNGGCGKTFTRKDALKRHQLVKGCGRSDDASD